MCEMCCVWGRLTQDVTVSALAIHLLPFMSFTGDRNRPIKAHAAVTFDLCPFFTYSSAGYDLRVTDLSNSPFLPIWTCELLKLPGCEGKEVTFHTALLSTILLGT